MHENVKIADLIKMAQRQMEDHGFSDSAIYSNLRTWRSVLLYANSRGIEFFSSELATQFLKDKYGVSWGESHETAKLSLCYYRVILRGLRSLIDFNLHGHIARELHGEIFVFPEGFAQAAKAYMGDRAKNEYQYCTERQHEHHLYRFTNYLVSRDVKDIESISAEDIQEYFRMLCHSPKATLAGIRGTLTKALRFFKEQGYCSKDLADAVPRIYYYARAKLSKIWSAEEIAKALDAIDRSNPTGKRDYAIILLAANLGLRTGDIVSLSIDNFDWKNGVITLNQQKTKEPLILPISEQIGKAVIDYWRNGRPVAEARELFVRHVLPYNGLGQTMLYVIFNTYFMSAGIPVPLGKRHGLHSLRHSLASRLLEVEVPVNVIGDILGHVNAKTALQYIRIDIKQLRECALEVAAIE